jgi:hypothetical protein
MITQQLRNTKSERGRRPPPPQMAFHECRGGEPVSQTINTLLVDAALALILPSLLLALPHPLHLRCHLQYRNTQKQKLKILVGKLTIGRSARTRHVVLTGPQSQVVTQQLHNEG